MKVLLEEIVVGHERGDILRQERGWKAFMLLPRLLLHRKCRGGKIGKDKLRERFDAFRAGRWASLLSASVENGEEAARLAVRKRWTQQHGDLEHRISRAMSRIQLGELTAGSTSFGRGRFGARDRSNIARAPSKTTSAT